MTREEFNRAFIAHARSCMGARWVHQGRDPRPGFGLDCAGLVVWSARASGFEVRDLLTYSRLPEAHVLLAVLDDQCDRMPLDDMKAGDVLTFQYADNPQHLAILTSESPLTICHAAANHRRVVEHILAPDMRARLRHVFRFKGLE